MPCMCGDTYCGSCGPAQGNSRCPHCGVWESDGGCADPEACKVKDKEWADSYAADLEEEKEYGRQFKEMLRQEYLKENKSMLKKFAEEVNKVLDLDRSRTDISDLKNVLKGAMEATGLVSPMEFTYALHLKSRLVAVRNDLAELAEEAYGDPRLKNCQANVYNATDSLKQAISSLETLVDQYVQNMEKSVFGKGDK